MHVVSKKMIPFAEQLNVYESMKNCEQFGGTLAFTRTEEEYKEVYLHMINIYKDQSIILSRKPQSSPRRRNAHRR